MSSDAKTIEENENKYTAVCQYINTNRSEWITAKMHKFNYPAIALGISAGVLFTGLTIAGILFFSSKKSGSDNVEFTPKPFSP